LKLANVVGIGIGLKEIKGEFSDQLALVVNVSRKKPLAELDAADVVPPRIEGVITDVQEVGDLKPL
jgi:hypothetical protein